MGKRSRGRGLRAGVSSGDGSHEEGSRVGEAEADTQGGRLSEGMTCGRFTRESGKKDDEVLVLFSFVLGVEIR
jgi:hypothetical protein